MDTHAHVLFNIINDLLRLFSISDIRDRFLLYMKTSRRKYSILKTIDILNTFLHFLTLGLHSLQLEFAYNDVCIHAGVRHANNIL